MVVSPAHPSGRPGISAGGLATLFVFASAMGWLEAVVVVYIRALLGIVHGALPPSPEILYERLRSLPWLLPCEQGREAMTIVMLASVAWLAGRAARRRWAAFLIAFGVWDIVYYVGLYALLRWPPSLTTPDLLFLVPPGPWWYQPVWVPISISCGMIGLGLRMARR